ADLARAPAAEPVPVVVNHVVAVQRARRRPLPQLVIQVCWYRRSFAPPDGRAAVRIPRAGEVGAADDPVPDCLHGFDGAWRAAALRSHLDHAARSEEHTSELQSRSDIVCRLLLEK